MRWFLTLCSVVWPAQALPCGLALLLAVDVSGSVDAREYRVQMDGLAAALQDGIVMDAMVDQQARIAVMQWSGSSRQQITIPWTALQNVADVAALGGRITADERLWKNYSTAIGEALELGIESFAQVPGCARKVIDVSGDGISNEGAPPEHFHAALLRAGIVVNALAIETDSTDLTGYFYENLIVGDRAFVMTAKGFEAYPAQIHRKLQRETTKQLASVGGR